jgi:hypothetical protein
MPRLLLPALLFLCFSSAVKGEVVRGVLLNDDDPYVVKAADGTIYKVEWYGGDSTCLRVTMLF